MVLLRHVEHAHAPIVRADVVQGLHPFKGVADCLCLPEPLAVDTERLVEAALVAQQLAPLPEGDDAAQHVAIVLEPPLQQGERVDPARGAHDAVYPPALVGAYGHG